MHNKLSLLANVIFLLHFGQTRSELKINQLSSLYSPPPPPSTSAMVQVQHCRDGCLEQHAADELTCLQGADCTICWNQCTAATKSINAQDLSNTLFDEWPLNIESMTRDQYLVNAVISWPIQMPPVNCLVTWEVLGGGLMGSLFTETNDAELSLWPNTKYNIQVTCKNKETKHMARSLLLTLDTTHATQESNLITVKKSNHLTEDYDNSVSFETSTEAINVQTTNKKQTNIKDTSIDTLKRNFDNPKHLQEIISDDYNDVNSNVHKYVTASSLLGIKITLVSYQRIEYGLFLCAGLILFVTVVAFVLWRWKYSSKLVAARQILIFDKQKLLQHEVLCHEDTDGPHDYLRIGY